MKTLSKTFVDAQLKQAGGRRRELADGTVPGLCLRVAPGGVGTWTLQLRVRGEGGVSRRGHAKKGRRYRLTLGTYPGTSIAAARELAGRYRREADDGRSPAAALERAATDGSLTVEQLGERFMSGYARQKLRSLPKLEQALRVHIIPRLGNKLADALERADVRALAEAVRTPREVPKQGKRGDRGRLGGPEAARTVVGVLRRLLSWGMDEGLVRERLNPAAKFERNLPRKVRRERVLSTEEARVVWEAAETLGYPFGPLYKLLLLTGCRKGELARGRWDWVDLKQALYVIPAASYKTDHVHVVPLVPAAVEIIKQLPRQKGPHLFSGTDGAKPLSGFARGQERMLRAVVAVSGDDLAQPWTAHDLRRTVATRVAERGPEVVVKRVLGHSDGGATAIYNRYAYVKETRAALADWAAELTA
jgi:integrase